MHAVLAGLVGFIAFQHLLFLVVEMFLWRTKAVRKSFGMSQELADGSAPLAMNQGLYNGFLVAGLVWGLSLGAAGDSIKIFFLGCVIVAGVFGALTANRRILWVQALPGAVAIALVMAS